MHEANVQGTAAVLIGDTEASAGHHTKSLQGVGHNYLINLTINFLFFF